MIQLVPDIVIDDIVTRRGYTPTLVRDLAARYRELSQHALKLEEALAYLQECVGGCPHQNFDLTLEQIRIAACAALLEHARLREERTLRVAHDESDP